MFGQVRHQKCRVRGCEASCLAQQAAVQKQAAAKQAAIEKQAAAKQAALAKQPRRSKPSRPQSGPA